MVGIGTVLIFAVLIFAVLWFAWSMYRERTRSWLGRNFANKTLLHDATRRCSFSLQSKFSKKAKSSKPILQETAAAEKSAKYQTYVDSILAADALA
jgi:hypothetical protein